MHVEDCGEEVGGALNRNLGLSLRRILGVTMSVTLCALPVAAATCSTADARPELSRQAQAAQASLSRVKSADIETDVPEAAQTG